ncbi:UNVERIFIED_CONTAM: F-box protein [Sesamum calycinum]|uniref:F-box protein n=1 Tax=Sesamum calycinum TaxID=2727403 RepID=A0AAW2SC26_9LAMI
MSSSSTTSASAADQGGGTTTTIITAIHPDIIQSHILNRLDGPTLASTTCASAQLLSLCNDDCLWKDICNSTWPSTTDTRVRDAISAFPSAHRSFYSDAFPPSATTRPLGKLISSVCQIRLELLDPKETVPTPLKSDDGTLMARAEDRLRVSWILIDPVKRRAVNLASRKAVEVRRHWLTDDIQVRYATVMGDGGGGLVQCAVVVTCGGKEDGGEVRVREVSMYLEEMEGKIVSGMESVEIFGAAMEGQRRRSDGEKEKEIYEMFLRVKAGCRERKQRREKGLDMVCISGGILIFFAIWIFFMWRR